MALHCQTAIPQEAEPFRLARIGQVNEDADALAGARGEDGSQQLAQIEWWKLSGNRVDRLDGRRCHRLNQLQQSGVWHSVGPSITLHELPPRPQMIWQTRTRRFDLSKHALLMGILNVTSDSFSDGGLYLDTNRARAHALEMGAAGAEIIDVGGESTRPGAEPVSAEEEMERVLPVIESLAGEKAFVLSVDTMKPIVARAAVEAGASIINDVGGLRDPAMLEVVRETGAGTIIMHMQGSPRTMQAAPHYADVCEEIREFFRQAFQASLRCGIDTMRLAFDPGIGFGKTVAHNLALLRNLAALRVDDRPLVLGVSRKSFIAKLLGSEEMGDRLWPTVALTSYARLRGANVLRVHDVQPNAEALRMSEAILNL